VFVKGGRSFCSLPLVSIAKIELSGQSELPLHRLSRTSLLASPTSPRVKLFNRDKLPHVTANTRKMAPPQATNLTATTPLSPAELSYLRSSLLLSPPIRPDARSPTTFRPLTAELDILPSTHGSSRIVWPDGGECIVGIKAEVEKAAVDGQNKRVEVSVEVAGQRDDDPLAVFLAQSVVDTIAPRLGEILKIGERWNWKVYIDVSILVFGVSFSSRPLGLALFPVCACRDSGDFWFDTLETMELWN
jgi:hypothetical protein